MNRPKNPFTPGTLYHLLFKLYTSKEIDLMTDGNVQDRAADKGFNVSRSSLWGFKSKLRTGRIDGVKYHIAKQPNTPSAWVRRATGATGR